MKGGDSVDITAAIATAIGLTALTYMLGQDLLVAPNSLAVTLALALQVATSWLLISVGCQGRFRPIIAVLGVFMLSWISLPATIQVTGGYFVWGDYSVFASERRVSSAALLLSMALLSFLIGYLWRESHRPNPSELSRLSNSIETRATHTTDSLIIYATFLLTIATLMLPMVAAGTGGFNLLFASRNEVLESLRDVDSGLSQILLRTVPDSLALGGTLVAIACLPSRKGSRSGRMGQPARVAVLVWGLCLVFVYLNPFANSRYLFISAVGAIALAATLPKSRKSAIAVCFVGIFGILLLYPLANSFRYGDSERAQTGLAVFFSGDFDGFQQAVNTVQYVEDAGIRYGHQSISAALMFVPRSIWTGKAEPASALVAEHRGYNFTNLSMPLPFELYLDFGPVGLAVIMCALGALAQRLDSNWGANPGADITISFIAVAQMGVVRGPMAAQLGFAVITVLVLLPLARSRLQRKLPSNGRRHRTPPGPFYDSSSSSSRP